MTPCGFACVAVLAIATALPAQSELVAALSGDDPAAREMARRKLAVMPVEDRPRQALVDLLRHRDIDVALAAVSVLGDRGRDDVPPLLARPEAPLRIAAFAAATPEELAEQLRAGPLASRVAALWELHDRDTLDDRSLLMALNDVDEQLSTAALRLALYECSPFPVALLPRLRPAARLGMLIGLTENPRLAAVPWLDQQMRRELPPIERLIVIAALPAGEIDDRAARFVIDSALNDELRPWTVRAARNFSPELADRSVGYAQSRLAAGADIEIVLACLDRVTPSGERQVLSMSDTLDQAAIETVCDWLAARDAEELEQRIAAALDGHVPLEDHLLRRAASQINSQQRVQRVAELMHDDRADRARLAFYTLVRAQVFHPDMLAFAFPGDDGTFEDRWSDRAQRTRALLTVPLQTFPPDVLLAWLDDPLPRVRLEVCRALARSPYPESVEQGLLERARDSRGLVGNAAGRAVASYGSRAAQQQLWASAPPRRRVEIVQWWLERPKPWTPELLQDTLASMDGGDAASDNSEAIVATLIGLAHLGDAAAGRRWLALAPQQPVKWLRRGRAAGIAGLRDQDLPAMRGALVGPQCRDEQERVELAGWLSARPDLPVAPILSELRHHDPSEEVRQAALGGLLAGERAAEFHHQLRRDFEAPLGIEQRDLVYEILAHAAVPVRSLELETLALLVLRAPLAAPLEECRASLNADDPRGADYPFHLPVVDVLRRDPDVGVEEFERVAAGLADHPARFALSGRRIGHLLGGFARFEHLRTRFAPVLAPLVLASLDLDRRYDGMAHLLLAEHAEDAGDWQEAAAHYTAALRGLVRRPLPPLLQRSLLGDENPSAGQVPLAALAARAHLCRAHAAAARGDTAGVRAALAVARDFGASDDRTAREIRQLTEETER